MRSVTEDTQMLPPRRWHCMGFNRYTDTDTALVQPLYLLEWILQVFEKIQYSDADTQKRAVSVFV